MHTKEYQNIDQAQHTPRLTLEQFKSGDSEAIGRVYPHLVEFARGFMGEKDGAEDLVQSAFEQAIKPLNSRSPEDFARFNGNVLPYIHRTIINTRINQVRRAERRVSEVHGISVEELPDKLLKDHAVLVDDLVITGMGESRAMQTLGEGLNHEYLDALYLREVLGLSYQEIADILGIPLGTVQSRLHRAKTKTKEMFEVDDNGILQRKPQKERAACVENETLIFLMERDGLSGTEVALRK